MARKRWQVNGHRSVMKPIKDTGRKCRGPARAFALFGDRRSAPRPARRGGRRALILAVATALLPAAATSSSAAGSASSSRVEISVSVAPRYKVMAVQPPGAARVRRELHSDWPCVETNLSAPTMPVTLVRSSTRGPDLRKAGPGDDMQLADGTATGIWRCGLMQANSASRTPNPTDRSASQLLLVRPE